MKKIISYILILVFPFIFFACEDYYNVEPNNYVLEEQSFEKETDALNLVYGVYSLLQPLVDQIWLIGEAQGDLVVAGPGANRWITEFTQNRVTPYNPYTDYTNFYKVIIAAHKAMEGLAHIRRNDPVNYVQSRYETNLAELIYVRAWVYLTLVKIWDRVPYIDYSVTSIEQIHNEAPVDGKIILENILEDIIKYEPQISTLEYLAPNSDLDIVRSRTMFTKPAAAFLKSEIYLYLDEIEKAYQAIRTYLPGGYIDQNVNKGVTPWTERAIIDNIYHGYNNGICVKQWVFFIEFDASRGQTNNLQRWTDNINGGIYAVKPSTYGIQYWKNTPLMLLEYQRPYFPDIPYIYGNSYSYFSTDENGKPIKGYPEDIHRGEGVSFWYSEGDTIIFKYLLRQQWIRRSIANGNANSNNDARFLIYRSTNYYLNVVEMVNNMGGTTFLALTMLNGAMDQFESTRFSSRAMPFEFDPNSGMTEKEQVDKFILEEMALQYGYEGLRWFDLVRFSKRPGYETWLADRVAQKYPPEQQEAIRLRLTDSRYWHLPYYNDNVIKNPNLIQKSGY